MRSKPSPGEPFSPVNDLPHRARIVEALLATPGVTLTPDAASALASMITDRASDIVGKRGKDGHARVRPERLRHQDVGDGEWVLELECQPTFNMPWCHNTRIEHRWADSGAPIRPWPKALAAANGEPTASLITRFDDAEHMLDVLGFANKMLADANSDATRGYSLEADLGRNGQERPGVAVIHAVQWPDASGQTTVRYALNNVLGNSRALARLNILGVTWEEAMFGLRAATLRSARPGNELPTEKSITGEHVVIRDPADAWNRLAAVYEAIHDVDDPDKVEEGYERVFSQVDLDAAARVAPARCRVVVGVSHPARVLELVQKRNLRDHLRGNQELDPEARHLAMGAEVIDAYVQSGRITPDIAPALAGAIAPDILAPGATPQVAEGTRRSKLVEMLFPTSDADRRLVSAALGEPTHKNQLRRSDAEHRSRVLTALVTRGQLNTRVGHVFSVAEAKDGAATLGLALPDLVARATKNADSQAADELLGFHAIVLLGESGLHEADRGSSNEGRRSAANVTRALVRSRRAAVGLVAEVVAAQAENRQPRKVDEHGDAIDGSTADKVWFDDAFPIKSQQAPAAPTLEMPPTPGQQLRDLQAEAAGLLASEFDELIHDFGDKVAEMIRICTGEGYSLDANWVADFNTECAKVRNSIMTANRFDELVALGEQP